MGQVTESPLEEEALTRLKEQVVRSLAEQGLHTCTDTPKTGLPVDYRFLQLLLTAAEDPEVSLGEFTRGVRVGPGARLPRQPALYPAKKKWSLKQQYDGEDYLTTVDVEDATWRKNYSLEPWKEKVMEVMEDQTSRRQVLRLTETEARLRFLDLVVASLGAIRKDKPGGVVTARVLFDGTNGIHVNRRTRIRDQERSPIAGDLKRLMREKSQRGRITFALTADEAEAHRQVPIDPRDWHMLGCQVEPGGAVFLHTGDLRSGVRVLLLVAGRGGDRPCHAVLFRKQSGHVASTGSRRLPPRGRRSRVSPRTPCLSLSFVSSPGSHCLGRKQQVVM